MQKQTDRGIPADKTAMTQGPFPASWLFAMYLNRGASHTWQSRWRQLRFALAFRDRLAMVASIFVDPKYKGRAAEPLSRCFMLLCPSI